MEHDFLLGDYNEEDAEELEGICDDILDSYPYILAVLLERYHDAIVETEYAQAYKHFCDCFELGVPFASAVLLHEYKRAGLITPKLTKTVEALYSKKLALGDWLYIFRELLAVEGADEVELCASIRSALLKRRKGFTRLGQQLFNRVAKVRNDYSHGSAPKDDVAKEIMREHELTLYKFFQALSPLQEWESVTIQANIGQNDEGHLYTIFPFRGTRPQRKRKIVSADPLSVDQYYLRPAGSSRKSSKFFPLSPFVVNVPYQDEAGANRFVYLYQTFTDKPDQLLFVSPDGEPRKITHLYTDSFWEFVSSFGCAPPTDDRGGKSRRKRRQLDWTTASSLARETSERFVGEMAREKYLRELYVPRAAVESAIDEFMRHEQRMGFALLGNSGAGKTCVLCHLTEKLLADGHLVATFYSKVFADTDPSDHLLHLFKSSQLDRLLDRLQALAEREGRLAVLMFDAINECIPAETGGDSMTPARLIGRLDRLLVSSRRPRVKVVLSCRTYTWEEARSSLGYSVSAEHWFTTRDLRGRDSEERSVEEINLGPFTSDELETVYPLYAGRYRLDTPLEDLRESRYRLLRHQLRDPFLLRFVSRCYEGRALPPRIESVELLSTLFNDLVQVRAAAGKAADQQGVLLLLAAEMHTRRGDSLEVQEIHDLAVDHQLRTAVFDDKGSYTPAVRSLIERGVLRLEQQTAWHEIRFVYDRFHEFVLAKVLCREIDQLHLSSQEGSRTGSEPWPDVLQRFFETELLQVRNSAVAWGALANTLILYWQRRGDTAPFVGLASSDVYGAQGLVVDVLDQLAQEDYGKARTIIRTLLHTPVKQAKLIKERRRLKQGIDDSEKKQRPVACDKLERLATLDAELRPITRVKRTAIKVLYDLYRSTFFTEGLYQESEQPLDLLWEVLADPHDKVRHYATLTIYYLWKEHPEVAFEIIERLGGKFLERGVFTRYRKRNFQREIEPSAQLTVLIAAESLVSDSERDRLPALQELWRKIVNRYTIRGMMLRAVVPHADMMVRKAAKTISEYVNNFREYQHFWASVPREGEGFTQETFKTLVPFLDPDAEDFERHHDSVVAGARLGDAFANFLLERVLIAQGVHGYERIAEVVDRIFENPDNELPAYTQLSMLYVVFHTLDKMPAVPEEHFQKFAEYMDPWTDGCRGRFMAHENKEANAGRPYKQYTLNWYGALHAKLYGDGQESMPLFEDYIEEAFEERDRELLVYALDNIAELAADFGYWRSALRLFEHCLRLFHSEEDLADFDEEREPPIRTVLARTLATIRGYFGREVDRFVMEDLATTDFPDFETFRLELVRHDTSETIGDLLTHKLGNFFVHGIVKIPEIRVHIQELLERAIDYESVDAWFGKELTPHLVRSLLGVDV